MSDRTPEPVDRRRLADDLSSLAGALFLGRTEPTSLAASSRALGRKLLRVATEVTTRQCPGPHAVVQHRDGRPPWCRACQRTDVGEPVDQLPGRRP